MKKFFAIATLLVATVFIGCADDTDFQYNGKIPCKNDAGCPEGQKCSIGAIESMPSEGICVDKALPDSCNEDEDCGDGYRCNSLNRCVYGEREDDDDDDDDGGINYLDDDNDDDEADDDDGDDNPVVPDGRAGIIQESKNRLIISAEVFSPVPAKDSVIYIAGDFPSNPGTDVCSNSWSVSLCGSYLERASYLKSKEFALAVGGLKKNEMARFFLVYRSGSEYIWNDLGGFSTDDPLIEDVPAGKNIRVGRDAYGDLIACGSGAVDFEACCNLYPVSERGKNYPKRAKDRNDVRDCYDYYH